MKKIIVLGLIILATQFLKANPLVPPSNVAISELTFDSNGNWVIELKFFPYVIPVQQIEKIYIKSLSGTSELKHFYGNIVSQTNMLVVRNDSLTSNLSINPLRDSISVSINYYTYPLYPDLVFGDITSSTLNPLRIGQSIALIDGSYSKDKSPTIGIENDTIGMCGTIKGKIYDPNNLLPANTLLAVSGLYNFTYDINGNYSARLTSSKHIIDKLYYHTANSNVSSGYYMKVTPITITTEPDTIVTVDLHIYDIVSSVEDLKCNQENIFKITPNPIKESSFSYEIAIPVKSSNSYIVLFNMSGQMVGRYSINESKGRINFQHKMQAGNYTVRLFVNDKNYANSKIIIAN